MKLLDANSELLHVITLPTKLGRVCDHRCLSAVGTCKSEIFVRIESRIESAGYDSNLESNQGVVIYVFNAD